MMYNSKLVASIKTKGRILKEFKDTVYMPFGVEYSVLLKNLHTTRAVVNVFIDGENAVPGGLVIDPGQSVDLERWIKNGNLTEGNKFKFIERTAAIENGPRGIKQEDGLIRVEYQFESLRAYKGYPSGVRSSGNIYPQNMPTTYNVGGMLRSADFSKGASTRISATSAINNYCADNGIRSQVEFHDGSATMDWCANETGITVPGSRSGQKFQHVTVGTLELEKHNIVLRILGDLGNNKPIEKPVTVKHKPKCVTCGHQNKHTAKFCVECGTALEIFA